MRFQSVSHGCNLSYTLAYHIALQKHFFFVNFLLLDSLSLFYQVFKLSLSRDEGPYFIQLITGLRTRVDIDQIRIRSARKINGTEPQDCI